MSELHRITERLGTVAGVDIVAGRLADLIKRAVPKGPRKDVLSGTWLGHALHPLLTDVPIGSFTSAAVLDVVGGRRAHEATDALIALGLVSALPTAGRGRG